MKLIPLLLGSGILLSASALTLWTYQTADGFRRATAEVRLEIARISLELNAKSAELDRARQELGQIRNLTMALATSGGSTNERALLRMGDAGWETNIPFIDLPKRILERNGVNVLNEKAEFTVDACVLFGLTEDQRQAIQQAYRVFEERVQEIERARLEPTAEHIAEVADKPEPKLSFRLHSFTNELEEVRSEWRQKIEEIAGPTRARLLTQHIRRPPDVLGSMFASGRQLPPWLNRGFEEHCTIIFRTRPDGTPARSFHIRAGEASSQNSGLAPLIPIRWRHLITEDMLGPYGIHPAQK